MNIQRTIGLFLGAVSLLSGAAFGQTEVPHEFTAGQPARAAEVNDNFASLASQIDSNAAAIAENQLAVQSNEAAIQANTDSLTGLGAVAVPRIKSNGSDIGTYLMSSEGGFSLLNGDVAVMSDTGFVFTIRPVEGRIGALVLRFATSDCTGQPYVDGAFNENPILGSGAVFRTFDINDQGPYYTEKGSVPEMMSLQSASRTQGLDTVCELEGFSTLAYPAIVNDPLISGVPNQTVFDRPITLGR